MSTDTPSPAINLPVLTMAFMYTIPIIGQLSAIFGYGMILGYIGNDSNTVFKDIMKVIASGAGYLIAYVACMALAAFGNSTLLLIIAWLLLWMSCYFVLLPLKRYIKN